MSIKNILKQIFSTQKSYQEEDNCGAKEILKNVPSMGKLLLEQSIQLTEQQAKNLKLLGRYSDAEDITMSHIYACIEKIEEFPQDPSYWLILTQSVLLLNPNKFDIENKLRDTINHYSKNNTAPIDLTLLYFSLGLLCHKKYGTCQEQLLAFHNGGICEIPKNCKFPSTVYDKARCHAMAFSAARVLKQQGFELLHAQKFHGLVPEVDPYDMAAMFNWQRGNL